MIKVSIKKKLINFTLDVTFYHKEGIGILFGKSGSGKTMTLNCISGFEQPDEGEIIINNQVLFSSRKRINIDPAKRKIGYILQEPFLFPHLNVRKNLLFAMKNFDQELFEKIISILDVKNLINRSIKNLSGGEKQRISIGRALLYKPKCLLMDEPVSSLDTQRRKNILKFIKKINRELKIPIIYVTHNWEESNFLGGNIGRIDAGFLRDFIPNTKQKEAQYN
jgi:molybdate transport system ATP-binding protein